MIDPADRTRPDDVAGQVVLSVAEGARDRLAPLCERYGTEGFALLNGGGAEPVLLGRDGEEAARFPADVTADDPALLLAIERELFASE